MVRVSPTWEKIEDQLVEFENECQPTDFFGLFALAAEFCKIAGYYSTIQDAHLRIALRKLQYAAKTYSACVQESTEKGLLNDPPKPKRTKIGELNQALQSPVLRRYFLYLPVATSLAVAARMVLAETLSDDAATIASSCLLNAGRFFPELAPLVVASDPAKLRGVTVRETTRIAQTCKALGYEPILLWATCTTAEDNAWGAWFQAAQTRGQERLLLLKSAAGTLGSAVSYLLRTEGVAPRKAFYTLDGQASMTAILRELAHKKLERLSAEVWSNIHDEPDFDSPTAYFVFREGIVRKRSYVIDLPDISCLSDSTTSATNCLASAGTGEGVLPLR
jgi:hypothetical protein